MTTAANLRLLISGLLATALLVPSAGAQDLDSLNEEMRVVTARLEFALEKVQKIHFPVTGDDLRTRKALLKEGRFLMKQAAQVPRDASEQILEITSLLSAKRDEATRFMTEVKPLWAEQSKGSGRGSRRLGDRFFKEKMYRLAARAYEQACEASGSAKSRALYGAARAAALRKLDAARRLCRYEKPRRTVTDQEMREFIGPLGNIRWMQDDPHAPARWVAVEGQFVWQDDQKCLQLERFLEFQAAWESPLDVNAIAFSPTRVWAATSVGLLCFDRSARQWTQRMIPGVEQDAAADDVGCADGKISVTIGGSIHLLDVSPETELNPRQQWSPLK